MKGSTTTLFLHVGAGKTATTAIQSAIPALRKQLERYNIRAPLDPEVSSALLYRPQPAGGFSFTLSKLLNPGFRRGKPFEENRAWEWLANELVKAREEGKNLLFSSEALQFAKKPRLIRLRALLQEVGWNIKIIYYARNAVDYSVSEYLQHLKTGFTAYPGKDYPFSLEDFMRQATVPFGYTLDAYSEVFRKDALVVKNYDVEKNELLKSFFCIVSGRNLEATAQKQVNRSLTRNEQVALESLLKLDGGASICAAVGAALVKNPRPVSHCRRYFLSEAILGDYAANNDVIVELTNQYLSADTPISLMSDSSPVQTDSKWEPKPDWHALYTEIIRLIYACEVVPRPEDLRAKSLGKL